MLDLAITSELEPLLANLLLQAVGMMLITSGKLPFVTHLGHQITTRHLSNLPSWSDPDIELSDDQRADVLTWKAYIEQTLTDLVVS